MLGKFSLDKLIGYGGLSAGLLLIIYLFTMIVLIMNFFVAILNDFLSAVANSKEMQSRDFEVMDHFVDTVQQMISSKPEDQKGERVISLCCRRRKYEHGISPVLRTLSFRQMIPLRGPSVCLSHSCTVLMPFDGMGCHLAGTQVWSQVT